MLRMMPVLKVGAPVYDSYGYVQSRPRTFHMAKCSIERNGDGSVELDVAGYCGCVIFGWDLRIGDSVVVRAKTHVVHLYCGLQRWARH